MHKRKYVPNLINQHSECQANYLRLRKLLPDNIALTHPRRYRIESSLCDLGILSLELTEDFKYTSTLQVEQILEGANKSRLIESPSMQVRMYHDVRMAEVISFQNRFRIQSVYPYPNKHMYQVDEKAQLNEFLGEWLRHCLSHGYLLPKSQTINN